MVSCVDGVRSKSVTDGARASEEFIAGGSAVTSAIISSESGDRWLRVFDAALTEEEIREIVFNENPDWWDDDPSLVYVEENIVTRFSQ